MSDNRYQIGVLVVEDEPLILKFTASLIACLGYRHVHRAPTAERAHAFLGKEEIALVISDVSLPDGDGRQIIGEAIKRNPHAVGVLITGLATHEVELPVEISRRVQFLQKPFAADDLRHLLSGLPERTGEGACPPQSEKCW